MYLFVLVGLNRKGELIFGKNYGHRKCGSTIHVKEDAVRTNVINLKKQIAIAYI